MFQLLQPIWLFAISGIIIPIIIHLWDVRGGKTLRIGSIILIQESAKLQGRSLRLTDILLLILRCLLIIVLAVVLAKPIFKKTLSSLDEKGWLLIEKQGVGHAYEQHKSLIDSLLRSGYKFHYFNKGFAEEEFADALDSDDTVAVRSNVSYWTLLKQLNEEVPTELPVHLFTDRKLKRFNGERPELSMSLKWQTYHTHDTVHNKPFAAQLTNSDSIRIYTANISDSSLTYNAENISLFGNNNFNLTNGKINIASEPNYAISIDTLDLKLIIFTDDYTADANYLKAALEAIGEYTQLDMDVEIVRDADKIEKKSDWIFWLSEKPAPVFNTNASVFMYEKGKAVTTNSWLQVINKKQFNQPSISVSRRIQAGAIVASTETIWADGFGIPLLYLESSGNKIYHFFSRFNPAWTELPWSAQFAEILFDLLLQEKFINNEFDERVIDAAQIQPAIAKEKNTFDKGKFVKNVDLARYLWLLAFLLFTIERCLSLRNKNEYA